MNKISDRISFCGLAQHKALKKMRIRFGNEIWTLEKIKHCFSPGVFHSCTQIHPHT